MHCFPSRVFGPYPSSSPNSWRKVLAGWCLGVDRTPLGVGRQGLGGGGWSRLPRLLILTEVGTQQHIKKSNEKICSQFFPNPMHYF